LADDIVDPILCDDFDARWMSSFDFKRSQKVSP
jgi:hypothetical protein